MANSRPKHEKDQWSKAEIDGARLEGVNEEDIIEFLSSPHTTGKMTSDEAKAASLERRADNYCPHCGEEHPASQINSYRKSHINRCAKDKSNKTQRQAANRSQPAPRLGCSTPTPFPTSSHQTASIGASSSSPSRSPKRKADKQNAPPSGDTQAEVALSGNNEQEDSAGSYSLKRLKLADDDAPNDLIIGNATFKHHPGTIDFSISRTLLTWHPVDRQAAWLVVIGLTRLTNFQQNTAGNQKGPVFKIFFQGPGESTPSSHVFRFADTEDGRRVTEAICKALIPFVAAVR